MRSTLFSLLWIPVFAVLLPGCSGGGSSGPPPAPSPPTITEISPVMGDPSGGTFVTLRGAHFGSDAKVTIGGVLLAEQTVVNETTVVGLSPPGAEGSKAVVVTTSGGSASLTAGYSYGAGTVALPVVGALASSVKGEVSSTGGEITWPSFTHPVTGEQVSGGSLRIPPNALPAEVAISIEVFAAQGQALPETLVYRLKPSGLTFSTPATLTVGYSGSWVTTNSLDETKIRLVVSSGNSVESVPATSRNLGEKTISVEIEHFSDHWGTDNPDDSNLHQRVDLLDAQGTSLVDAQQITLPPLDDGHEFWTADHVALVIHGLSGNSDSFRNSDLASFLSDRFGKGVAYFEYPSGRSIQSNADALDRLLAQRKQGVHLFAHSMGGLVSRAYLENLRPVRRVASLVTFGTPHKGSLWGIAYLRYEGVRDLIPGSAFLDNLNAPPANTGSPPYYVVIAANDKVVKDDSERGAGVLQVEGEFLVDTRLYGPKEGHSVIYKQAGSVYGLSPSPSTMTVRQQLESWMDPLLQTTPPSPTPPPAPLP
ncbi:MAG: IPT/TIG domain-containing protein, partial [Planctomycetes bacterium]|nr:IPT/TIG domain-containing protein [Planctomycetota bacterium]